MFILSLFVPNMHDFPEKVSFPYGTVTSYLAPER
jgi:hypothetical protein